MNDDVDVELSDEDEAEDGEWEVDEREIPEALNYAARSALDSFLRQWKPETRVLPAAILERA
jgi:hypothetical protein